MHINVSPKNALWGPFFVVVCLFLLIAGGEFMVPCLDKALAASGAAVLCCISVHDVI